MVVITIPIRNCCHGSTIYDVLLWLITWLLIKDHRKPFYPLKLEFQVFSCFLSFPTFSSIWPGLNSISLGITFNKSPKWSSALLDIYRFTSWIPWKATATKIPIAPGFIGAKAKTKAILLGRVVAIQMRVLRPIESKSDNLYRFRLICVGLYAPKFKGPDNGFYSKGVGGNYNSRHNCIYSILLPFSFSDNWGQ